MLDASDAWLLADGGIDGFFLWADFLPESAISAHPKSFCRSRSMNKWGFTGISYLCSIVKGHKLGGKGLSLKLS